ncbi:MAG: hypothetical protein EBR82_85920 [Caulobacteraceae bacterium]|nr:hypothetical protein [Caulobacteraceae bacterium]
MSGVSGYIGQTQGTLYAEVDIRNIVSAFRIPILVSDGSANPFNGSLLEFSNSSAWRGQVRANNAQIFTIAGPTSQPQGIYKVALGYKSGDSVLYVNGTQVATSSASFTFAAALTTTNLYGASAPNNILNDRLRAAAIYPTRLSNDELQNLTRLT